MKDKTKKKTKNGKTNMRITTTKKKQKRKKRRKITC